MRGDIYRLQAPRNATGHEQAGRRYAIEVQGFANLSTVVVVPTSTKARPALYRPAIEMDGTTTRVLVEQITAVDLDRLGEMVGRLSPQEMAEVDAALRLLLGLH